MRISRDNSLISVATSDGYIKFISRSSHKILLSQKRHNLPVTSIAFTNADAFMAPEQSSAPTHVLVGSADYTYNIIKTKGEPGILSIITGSVSSLFFYLILSLIVLLSVSPQIIGTQ